MRYVALILALALVVLGAAYGVLQRKIASVAEESERRASERVQKAREVESRGLKSAQDEAAMWRRRAADAEAEVVRRRSAATAAARQTETVKQAGDVLRAAPADTVLAECARQGYQCRMARSSSAGVHAP